jgi:hypothetical protein
MEGVNSNPLFFYCSLHFINTLEMVVVSLPRQTGFDAGAAPRAGYFLLRGQEKVTKEKAARGLAAARFPALLVISGPFVQLARHNAASLKHALAYP